MAPSVREIGEHLELSAPAWIHRLLHVLKEKGYIVAEAGKKRSWRLSRNITGQNIPLLGDIAAGPAPCRSDQSPADQMWLPAQ